MELLANLSLNELEDVVKEYNQPTFRASQLYKWINLGAAYCDMSDIPAVFREKLAQRFSATSLKILKTLISADGSQKYLFELCDGNLIESVYMPHDYGNTVCVSTQAGCRMGCVFCASGMNGLSRNLTAGEILGQVIYINSLFSGTTQKRQISNIVLMGSGEPLDNYANVTKFIDLACSPKGLNFSQRNISLSTCGLAENIKRLADDGYTVTLSVSLHATTDESRQELMPIAKKYSLTELIDSVKYYFKKTGRRIIFEYSLVKDKNMNSLDIKRLAQITKGYPSHINLIMLNKVEGKDINGCTKQEAQKFLAKLTNQGISATLRRSAGSDIEGACGQLRRTFGGCKTD